MSDLIKVTTNENGDLLVSGRELHEGLEVKTRYDKWFERKVEKYNFVENIDFVTVVQKRPTAQGNQTKFTDHALTIGTAKEMAMTENTKRGQEVRRYFIGIEEEYKQSRLDTSNLSPELQMFNGLFNAMAKQELATKAIDAKVDNISEIVSLNSIDWKKDTNQLINKIAKQRGGFEAYRDVRNEIYEELERRAKVLLKKRLTNKRRRMADEGVSKSKRDKLTIVDVISDDKKLIEIYLAVVKDFAIKHKVHDNNLNTQREQEIKK